MGTFSTLSNCTCVMSFTVIEEQPQPHGIVREKHLSENIWIKKLKKQTYQEELQELLFVRELHINRKIKKKGKKSFCFP